jgi:hypothetical protein
VFHDETLWFYDPADDDWQRASLSGQGKISTAVWSEDGETLYVADDSTRVSLYDGQSLELQERLTPSATITRRVQRWFLNPLYAVLPRPGELYKTFDYLVSSTEEADEEEESRIAKSSVSPLAPVWSSLTFIVIALAATCVYFERQEY